MIIRVSIHNVDIGDRGQALPSDIFAPHALGPGTIMVTGFYSFEVSFIGSRINPRSTPIHTRSATTVLRHLLAERRKPNKSKTTEALSNTASLSLHD